MGLPITTSTPWTAQNHRRQFRNQPPNSLQEVLEKEFDEAEAFEEEYGSSSNHNNNGDGGDSRGNARELAAELEIQDAVFMSSYIPRSLHEVCLCVCVCMNRVVSQLRFRLSFSVNEASAFLRGDVGCV